jgi:hypothetical protein
MRMAFLRGVAMMEVGPIAPAITTQLIPDAWGAWSKNRRKSQTCRGQSDTFRPNCGEVNFQPPLNARRNKDNGTTQLAHKVVSSDGEFLPLTSQWEKP